MYSELEKIYSEGASKEEMYDFIDRHSNSDLEGLQSLYNRLKFWKQEKIIELSTSLNADDYEKIKRVSKMEGLDTFIRIPNSDYTDRKLSGKSLDDVDEFVEVPSYHEDFFDNELMFVNDLIARLLWRLKSLYPDFGGLSKEKDTKEPISVSEEYVPLVMLSKRLFENPRLAEGILMKWNENHHNTHADASYLWQKMKRESMILGSGTRKEFTEVIESLWMPDWTSELNSGGWNSKRETIFNSLRP